MARVRTPGEGGGAETKPTPPPTHLQVSQPRRLPGEPLEEAWREEPVPRALALPGASLHPSRPWLGPGLLVDDFLALGSLGSLGGNLRSSKSVRSWGREGKGPESRRLLQRAARPHRTLPLSHVVGTAWRGGYPLVHHAAGSPGEVAAP